VIELNGSSYRLCLIDTNIVSEMLKRPQQEFANFLTKYVGAQCIPCFSIWTLLELRESRNLFPPFLEYFSVIPCAIIKSHEQLLEGEVAVYSTQHDVDPILFAATPLRTPLLRDAIDTMFADRTTEELAVGWLDGRRDALEGMLKLRGNYPPANGRSYTRKEISFFIFSTVTSQLGMRQHEFCQQVLGQDQAIDIDRFPSVKASSYTVFFKFYVDDRKERRSDVFDVLISTAVPYVDVFLTERHQAEVLRRTQQHDGFVNHVEVHSIEALR